MDPIILVAEDSQDDVMFLQWAFSKMSSPPELRFVHDGEEAMAYLKARRHYCDRQQFPFPTLLLLDIKMPGMDGLEVLAAVRGDSELTRLTVVVFSSSDDQRDINRASDLHANSYLVKPSDYSMFIRICHSLENYWLRLNHNGTRPVN